MSATGVARSAENLVYLRTPVAIRERAGQVLKYVEDGRSPWWSVDAGGLEAAVQATLAVTRRRFPNPAAIPFHSRWRHFEAGGHDRWAELAPRLAGLPKDEIARRMMDLAVVSVLLDAGAGPAWSWREPETGETYARSEGLGVASFHMFANGAFSRDAKGDPLRVDAERLAALTPMDIAMGFQVKAHNPLTGLEGRAGLLRKLGGVGLDRPGALFDVIARDGGTVKAAAILAAVLDRLSPIWPSPMGDVWPHPVVGLVPFHKLSQWLSYSLVEPIESAGLKVADLDALTGLPEYRNGGLLVDAGALRPKQSRLLSDVFKPGDEAIVEWRALTVALLDQVGAHVRLHLGMDATQLPLVKVLEAGTWFAGRVLAAERRPGGGPPIAVESDGTVF
ncbi:URC4/urg3 family protein [Reyranella sp.]|uniref:URC4/urg3 family protein n=1 Tax=Reyranella sp. TaxID=1929291 RepID=UPI003D142EEA